MRSKILMSQLYKATISENTSNVYFDEQNRFACLVNKLRQNTPDYFRTLEIQTC